MPLTRDQQQFILNALAQVYSRRFTDVNVRFILADSEEDKSE